MKFTKHLTLFFSALLMSFAAHAADYKILLAENASPVEKTAAGEMKFFAEKLLGKSVDIVKKADSAGQYIRIGATADAEKALRVKLNDFADDELIIKTINGDIYLAGGAKRGTLYAVYEYLERFCGVRFLTPEVNHIPQLKTAGKLPEANFRYKPNIKVRHISMRRNTLAEKLFSARRRLNGSLNHLLPLPDELGGGEHILGCHTFQRFVPPTRKGLAETPEFYAMIKGVRVHDAQLCMSNKKLRIHVADYIRQWLKKHPEATRISVSMNDYKRFCQCPECTNWLKERNAVISDILLDFVNDVAAQLEKEFPKIEFVTLAYLDARKPPKVIKPRKNVGILYCFIEIDGSKPMSHERNKWMAEELAAWRKTGVKIYVWIYSINQKLPFLSQPNWEALNEDLRCLEKENTEWVFCEFTYPENYITDFIRMRFYIMSALLWNPEKSLDELIEEFCICYYGSAASPKIIEALKIIRKSPAENQDVFICNFASSVIRAYGKENFIKAWSLMQQARKIAEASKNKEIQNRVELAVIPYDMTLLHDCFDLRNNLPPELAKFDPASLLDRDIAILKANKITNFFPPKNYTLEHFRKKIIRLWGHNDGEVSAGIEKVPGTIVWSAAQFHNQNRRQICIADDPEALGGKALQVIANGKRLPRLEFDNALRGKYRIYLTIKVEVDGKPQGLAMTGNLWESSARWVRRAKPMKLILPENPGKGYNVYLLGEAEFKPSYDLQIPLSNDPAIKNLLIDRIILVPVK